MDLNPETYKPYRPSSGFRWAGGSWTTVVIYALVFSAVILIEQTIARNIGEDGAIRAAEGLGYSQVKVTDRHTFFPNFQGCSRDDLVMFDVTGVDPKGETREFIVCDGLWKASTVRFK